MTDVPNVSVNQYNGYYDTGKPLSPSKWLSISRIYEGEKGSHGKCSVRTLAKLAGVSHGTAQKAINLASKGLVSPPKAKRGHGRKGVGSMKNFTSEHDNFLYYLYKKNPSLPLYGYCEEFFLIFKIKISTCLVMRWFNTIGKYKGSLRVTDVRPSRRDTYENCFLLKQYLDFLKTVKDVKRLVFADEKTNERIDDFFKNKT